MADNTIFEGDLTVYGNTDFRGTKTPYLRSELAQDSNSANAIPLADLRIWDAFQTSLTTAGTDDLGITAGAFATGVPFVTGGDCKNISATRYARFQVQLPHEYVGGETVALRAVAGMFTTVASGSATVDFEAYKVDVTNGLITGSDLVSTAAQSINLTAFANKDFNLTATTLNPGDWIDVRVTLAVVDVATATAVTPAIVALSLLADSKG
jgi:hypothetical protein